MSESAGFQGNLQGSILTHDEEPAPRIYPGEIIWIILKDVTSPDIVGFIPDAVLNRGGSRISIIKIVPEFHNHTVLIRWNMNVFLARQM